MRGRPGRRCAPPTCGDGEDGDGGEDGHDGDVDVDDHDGDSGDDYNDDDDDDNGTPMGRVGRPRHHHAHRVVHLSGTRRIRLL